MTYTVDEILTRAKERNLTPPAWGKSWSRLKDYNGFTHEQRVKGWQAMHLAVRMKLISPTKDLQCEICGATHPTKLQYHSEDYCKLAEYVLCISCHKCLHQRYKNLEIWQELVACFSTGNEWYKHLSTER